MIEERLFQGGHYAAELEAPAVYRGRRNAVQKRLDRHSIALFLGATDARGYGDTGTFKQDPTFFYLTGVELPNAVLMLEKTRETLFLPARRPNIEVWTGPKFGPGPDTARELGFEHVLDCEYSEVVIDARRRPVPGYQSRLADALASGGALHAMLPAPSAGGPLSREQELISALRTRLPDFPVRDVSGVITELRLRKSGGELALMEKAAQATAGAMRAAARAVAPGVGEGAIDGEAFAALRKAGAEGWSFPPIVGSGLAGCILHYDANRGTLTDGELVVVDIGARWGYYCGDLTRTFPVSGRFTKRQRQLYDEVLASYDAAVAEIKPGRTLAAARQAAFGSLEASKLRGDGGKTLGQFFIHGIGHFLGLEAHDVGGESPELEPGMVVTVEPGVYLPGEETGIRIEDDYVVTATGSRCLSEGLPRDAAAVEKMLSGK